MKNLLITILLLFSISLTACSPALSGITDDTAQANDDMSIETKLVVGTIKLEDTDQTVTNEQAKELVTMWQVYEALINSETTAQAEVDSLMDQIQETMTADQLKTITAMNLTQQDAVALIQEKGLTTEQIQVNGSDSSSSQTDGGFSPPEGGDMAGSASFDGSMTGMDVTRTNGCNRSGPGRDGSGQPTEFDRLIGVGRNTYSIIRRKSKQA